MKVARRPRPVFFDFFGRSKVPESSKSDGLTGAGGAGAGGVTIGLDPPRATTTTGAPECCTEICTRLVLEGAGSWSSDGSRLWPASDGWGRAVARCGCRDVTVDDELFDTELLATLCSVNALYCYITKYGLVSEREK